ncbi:MAG: hypothetical protein K8R21_01330 [Leptospira sp.]|nr:hypothetical protein [Leptospira sp.]
MLFQKEGQIQLVENIKNRVKFENTGLDEETKRDFLNKKSSKEIAAELCNVNIAWMNMNTALRNSGLPVVSYEDFYINGLKNGGISSTDFVTGNKGKLTKDFIPPGYALDIVRSDYNKSILQNPTEGSTILFRRVVPKGEPGYPNGSSHSFLGVSNGQNYLRVDTYHTQRNGETITNDQYFTYTEEFRIEPVKPKTPKAKKKIKWQKQWPISIDLFFYLVFWYCFSFFAKGRRTNSQIRFY